MSGPTHAISPPRHSEDTIVSTTIIASNIHCPSCVSRIKEALREKGVIVNVYTTTGEVKVLHPAKIHAEKFCKALSDESYEPHSVVTSDVAGHIIYEQSLPDAQSRGGRWWTRVGSLSKQQRDIHHVNCEACRSGKPGFSHVSPSTDGSSEEEKQHTHRVTPEAEIGAAHPVARDLTKSGAADINAAPSTWKLVLSITGMTCASCSTAITNAVQEMEDVASIKVDLMSNSAVVVYNGTKDYSKHIVETVEEKGYDAEVHELVNTTPQSDDSSDLFRAKLSIGGMTCASCTNAVTSGVEKLPYVTKVNVTLMTNSAVVEFSGLSNLDKVKEEIEDSGYDCAIDSWENLSQHNEAPKQRTVDIKIEGMFCQHCPLKVLNALDSKLGSSVTVVKRPEEHDPVMTVQYMPSPPQFTIRSIMSAIEGADNGFHAHIYHPPSIEERSKRMQARERWRMLTRLIFSFVAAIPALLIGIVWMSLDTSSNVSHYLMHPWIKGKRSTRIEWALFWIATPVFFFSASIFHMRAFKEVKALWRPGSKTPILRRFYRFGSMNLLITCGTSVAYAASLALLITHSIQAAPPVDPVDPNKNSHAAISTYFDSVVFLTFFILIGQFLEAFSKSRTGDAVSMLGNLKPDKATLVSQDLASDASKESSSVRSSSTIEADLLEIGDLVIVPHGSSPPADGVIVNGSGKFDESSLTGESRPVSKGLDEEVFTGTISVGDSVTIRVTKVGGSSMIDQIVSVVREGLGKRAPVERYADMLTSYFVPAITAIAILTWVVWLILGYSGALDPRYMGDQTGGWAFWSLNFAISVFVTACPCGIGLAAPTALFAGIGIAAKLGILVQGGGEAFQEAPYLDAVVFDKTGTLTEGGNLKVSNHEMVCDDEEEKCDAWSMVHMLEQQSGHPIAQAIVEFAHRKAQTALEYDSISETPGRGLCGTFLNTDTGRRYEAAIGSEQHMMSLDHTIISGKPKIGQLISRWQNQAQSIAVFALRDASIPDSRWKVKAIFGTSDPIRESAPSAVADLQRRGIKVYMLSGDHALTAIAVGTRLSIPETNIFSNVMPTDKAEKIRYLQRTLPSRKQRGKPSIFSKARWARKATPEPESPSDVDPERQLQHSPDSKSTQASVAFVGDGINDAPALLASSLSISLSTGAPVAMTASSFILLSSDLTMIPQLIDLSRIVYRRIKINFGWALVYNVILIPIAAGVLFKVREDGWRLGPVWASLAMALSSVSVVLSSLLLKYTYKYERA